MRAELRLCGQVLATTENLKHLGILSKFDGKSKSLVESCVKKLYAAANAVIGKLRPVCRTFEVWNPILERQLPVLSYGCCLLSLNSKSVLDMVANN